MKFIKAKERLPDVLLGESRPFHCRSVDGKQKKVLWYGKGNKGLLNKEPWNWEWLDEDFKTDYDMGFRDAINQVSAMVSIITSKKPLI